MSLEASEPPTNLLLVRAGQPGAVVLKAHLTRADAAPERLCAIARERLGVRCVLLHDGGLSLGVEAGPVLLEALDELPCGPLAVTAAWREPRRARAWQRPGWFEQTVGWLEDILAARGERLREVHQVSTYDLACVLRADTDGGGVYLKAGSDAHEMIVTAYLAEAHPSLTPEIVGRRRGAHPLLVTRRGGERLSETGELTVWREAVSKLARFQRTADARAFRDLRCPTHPFSELADRAEAFLRDAPTLRGWGVDEGEIAALAALAPRVRRAHARVRALDLPDLPAHGDAQPMNALSGPKGPVWFDWSEASLAHPFMDLGWCLAWLLHPARTDLPVRRTHPDAPTRIWTAYLEALGVREAEPLMPDALTLAMAHRALVYADKYTSWSGTVPGWRPQYVPHYLRLLKTSTGLTNGSG